MQPDIESRAEELRLAEDRRNADNIGKCLSQFVGGTLQTTIGLDSWLGTIVEIFTNVSKNTTTISEKNVHMLNRETQTFSIKQGTSSGVFSTTVLLSGTFIFENQYVAQDGPGKIFVFTKKSSGVAETSKKNKFRSIDEE